MDVIVYCSAKSRLHRIMLYDAPPLEYFQIFLWNILAARRVSPRANTKTHPLSITRFSGSRQKAAAILGRSVRRIVSAIYCSDTCSCFCVLLSIPRRLAIWLMVWSYDYFRVYAVTVYFLCRCNTFLFLPPRFVVVRFELLYCSICVNKLIWLNESVAAANQSRTHQ